MNKKNFFKNRKKQIGLFHAVKLQLNCYIFSASIPLLSSKKSKTFLYLVNKDLASICSVLLCSTRKHWAFSISYIKLQYIATLLINKSVEKGLSRITLELSDSAKNYTLVSQPCAETLTTGTHFSCCTCTSPSVQDGSLVWGGKQTK